MYWRGLGSLFQALDLIMQLLIETTSFSAFSALKTLTKLLDLIKTICQASILQLKNTKTYRHALVTKAS